MVSSVSPVIPLFLILINLSSIRQARFSTAEPLANILAGFRAESPYAAFFSSNKSRTPFAISLIFSDDVIIVLVLFFPQLPQPHLPLLRCRIACSVGCCSLASLRHRSCQRRYGCRGIPVSVRIQWELIFGCCYPVHFV